eukprot:SAG31_NODE_5633_length_2412_cov_1.780804_1_plen_284_part_00
MSTKKKGKRGDPRAENSNASDLQQQTTSILKRLNNTRGHISKKRKFQKQASRSRQHGALAALASAYEAAPLGGGADGRSRLKQLADSENSGKHSDEISTAGAAACSGGEKAANVAVAAGQSNWVSFLQAQPKSNKKPRRTAAAALKTRSTANDKNKQLTNKAVEKPRQLREILGEEQSRQRIAMDCEMVGVGPGGKRSMLARVAIVCGATGATLCDLHVQPMEKVTDYRTFVSGVRPYQLRKEHGAVKFKAAQAKVARLLQVSQCVATNHEDPTSLAPRTHYC